MLRLNYRLNSLSASPLALTECNEDRERVPPAGTVLG